MLPSPSSPSPAPAPAPPPPPPLSKSARKKLARAERFAEHKLERRAREKEMRKEKRRVRAEKRAAGELDDDDDDEARRKKRPRVARPFGARVVIDLGFDELMSEKEVRSLCSQLSYTYSANRTGGYAFRLLCTSLGGRVRARLDATGDASYRRWAKTEWWEEGYERLWTPSSESAAAGGEAPPKNKPDEALSAEADASNVLASNDNQHIPVDGPVPRNPDQPLASGPLEEVTTAGESTPAAREESIAAPSDGLGEQTSIPDEKQNIVYLTADAEEELTELKENKTYIIGGLVDRNRYKNICLNKATASGIRAARLPIGRYLASLPTRKVLTVNQVFEILLRWVETRDWEAALHSVVPKRKFNVGGKRAKSGEAEDDDENGGEDENENEDAPTTEAGGEVSPASAAEGKSEAS